MSNDEISFLHSSMPHRLRRFRSICLSNIKTPSCSERVAKIQKYIFPNEIPIVWMRGAPAKPNTI